MFTQAIAAAVPVAETVDDDRLAKKVKSLLVKVEAATYATVAPGVLE